jgi:hypothetical protein
VESHGFEMAAFCGEASPLAPSERECITEEASEDTLVPPIRPFFSPLLDSRTTADCSPSSVTSCD